MLHFPAFLTATAQQKALLPALIILFVLALVLIAGCVAFTVMSANKRKNTTRTTLLIAGYVCAAVVLIFAIVCLVRYLSLGSASLPQPPDTSASDTAPTQEPTPEPTPEPTEPPTEPEPTLNVEQSDSAKPSNMGIKWEIIENGAVVGSFNRNETISFGNPGRTSYFALPGVATFRGDNYRNNPVYGSVNIVNNTLTKIWEKEITSLPKPGSGYWTGCGWTGQPLMVQWDSDTKKNMNIYPDKQAKEDLVEVIYATLDGHIYFYDLQDGSYTRDPLNVGMAFKGAGALDPRGYPLLYVGSGDKTADGKSPKMYIISLIDGTILHEFGYHKMQNRGWWACDSAALVHAETDTLIWPNENGLLYTIKLNTQYDKAAGTISINPDSPVMNRYSGSVGGKIGWESSSVIVENYIYLADNGGRMFCVDLNTMELKWCQNVHDDTNATPVFAWENGVGYLYTGTSMELSDGTVYITKLNASTGEVVWEKIYTDVYYDSAVSGGILGSPVLGKEGTELEGLIVYPIARTPGTYNGLLVALDTETGEPVWEKKMSNYAWSSPVALYNEDGTAFLILSDSAGKMHLMDGKTGDNLTTITLGANIEASPAVFNDMLVVGTRGQKVFGIKIG